MVIIQGNNFEVYPISVNEISKSVTRVEIGDYKYLTACELIYEAEKKEPKIVGGIATAIQ